MRAPGGELCRRISQVESSDMRIWGEEDVEARNVKSRTGESRGRVDMGGGVSESTFRRKECIAAALYD